IADHGPGYLGVCDPDDADQELLSRRDQQAICTDRPRQRADRAPGTLRPRLSQRDAARGFRDPGRADPHPVHRFIAYRGHLLARRPWPAWLRGGNQPRLPDNVRHPLRLHADRALAQIDQRFDLHAYRSTNRLRLPARLTGPPSTIPGGSIVRVLPGKSLVLGYVDFSRASVEEDPLDLVNAGAI